MGCNCLELSYYRVQVSPLVTQTTDNSCKVKKKKKIHMDIKQKESGLLQNSWINL